MIIVLSSYAVSLGQISGRLSWEVLTWEFLRGCIQVSAGAASSGGLIVAMGSASMMLTWQLGGGLGSSPCTPPSSLCRTPCLGPLATWQLASHRVRDPKEQGRTHSAFYHLALEVVFRHFHEILLVTQASPLFGGRGLHGVWIPGTLDHWGVTLEAGYHPSVCMEPGRYSWSICV